MSTLILVTCDSGAGHLKQERRADRILSFPQRLVSGPVTVDGAPEAFFQQRRALYESEGLFHEPYWFDVEDITGDRPKLKRVWSKLPEICLAYDRVELWVDPDPNAQLILFQLLDWLGHIPELADRLWLKQAEMPLGERRPGDLTLPLVPIGRADVALARRAWRAFGSPTPEAWVALRDNDDLDCLPGLVPAIDGLLDELPDRTGLGATARRVLRLVDRQPWWDEVEHRGGDVSTNPMSGEDHRPMPLFKRVMQHGKRLPLSYSEIGEILCELGNAPAPALAGITEQHFTDNSHHDTDRFRRFRESTVSLTPLGLRLAKAEGDWASHNPVHRWWGGTRLSNDNLWRWDASMRQLLAPR